MKNKAIASLMAVALFSIVLASQGLAAAPRLGVVVVVDQMRADYLDRSDSTEGGFRRLKKEAAVFTQARHIHLPTETGPGHAALSTGRTPAVHGIVGNLWFDRAAGQDVYCVTDSVFGLGPEHLQGPTLADAWKASDSKARVFSVSFKDRAAILMGGRRADLVLWFDTKTGEFTTSSYYRRPMWLAEFNRGLRRSGVLAPVGDKVPKSVYEATTSDEAVDSLVAELVKREGVGRPKTHDLLMISYSATDFIGHRYGIDTNEMNEQLAAVDRIIGRLLRRLESLAKNDFVLALSADHGAIPSQEDASGRALGVRKLESSQFQESLELALQKNRPLKNEKWLLSVQLPNVYVNPRALREAGDGAVELVRSAARVLARVEGVDQTFVAADLLRSESAHESPVVQSLRRSYFPGRSGDILLTIRENLLIHDRPHGTSHGTQWDYDTRIPLVFIGRGVRPGKVDAPAAAVDLAPTMARLLGLEYPAGPDGAVRGEALAN